MDHAKWMRNQLVSSRRVETIMLYYTLRTYYECVALYIKWWWWRWWWWLLLLLCNGVCTYCFTPSVHILHDCHSTSIAEHQQSFFYQRLHVVGALVGPIYYRIVVQTLSHKLLLALHIATDPINRRLQLLAARRELWLWRVHCGDCRRCMHADVAKQRERLQHSCYRKHQVLYPLLLGAVSGWKEDRHQK